MKKSLLMGAMVLAASAATASAAEYGFYTTYGGAYCDGLQFTGSSPAVGQHIYDQVYCVYPNTNLGGFQSKIKAIGKGKWFTFPVSNVNGYGAAESYVYTYYVNTASLEWVLYYESTDYNIPFSKLISGLLEGGPPYAHIKPGAKHLGSVIHESMAKIRK